MVESSSSSPEKENTKKKSAFAEIKREGERESLIIVSRSDFECVGKYRKVLAFTQFDHKRALSHLHLMQSAFSSLEQRQ